MTPQTLVRPVPTAKTPLRPGPSTFDLVVFSHLRWDFVYQRPQHILSRLARTKNVLFVEEPLASSGVLKTSTYKTQEGVTVLRPCVAGISDIGAPLRACVGAGSIPVAWFYSPAFVGLLDSIDASFVVYDCMDELSLFKGADSQLARQEAQLMKRCDIVFTGGRSLYEAKSRFHPNVHCFPSSVERDHFRPRPARAAATLPPPDLCVKGPIAGYYGVIDERIDLELLDQVAAKLPGVQFVMIGPVVKISTAQLPRRRNIHYLGMKSYEDLPLYLHHFDVAIMPFAKNPSTRFISPTKTLEFMAAGKPIVSTSVPDVVSDFGDCVAIHDHAGNFAEAVTAACAQHDDGRATMLSTYDSRLSASSWDGTVRKMRELIDVA